MKRARPLAVVLFATFLLASPPARAAADAPFAPRMFFGSTIGPGLGVIRHPLLRDQTARLGVQYDPCVGFVFTSHWGGCIELSTWQYTPSGRPAHLHMFALRAEYLRDPIGGPFLAFALGPLLTDGIVGGQRFGPGLTLATGWRWETWDDVTVGIVVGTHAGAYADGWAVNPFLAFELRFYGRL